jgi:hypothetical protein
MCYSRFCGGSAHGLGNCPQDVRRMGMADRADVAELLARIEK